MPAKARDPICLSDTEARRRRRSSRARHDKRLRLAHALRRLLGLPASVTVDGVSYRERSALPLARALSPEGPGLKEYDARFPGGETMRLRATPARRYADLGQPDRRPIYERVADRIRPGMRILDLGCGTGDGAAWLADRVGRSGGVVAVSTDRESIRFARRRYPLPNLAFEIGRTATHGLETLAGEPDASFDAVFAEAPPPPDKSGPGSAARPDPLAELFRVLDRRPGIQGGGWMLLTAEPAAAAGLEARIRAAARRGAPPDAPEPRILGPREGEVGRVWCLVLPPQAASESQPDAGQAVV